MKSNLRVFVLAVLSSVAMIQGALASESFSVSIDNVTQMGGGQIGGTVYYNGRYKQITVIDRTRGYNDCDSIARSAYWGRRGMNLQGYGTVQALNSERTNLLYIAEYALDCRLK